jgi:hypothetical protein
MGDVGDALLYLRVTQTRTSRRTRGRGLKLKRLKY